MMEFLNFHFIDWIILILLLITSLIGLNNGFIKEFLNFLLKRKKFWLLPIILVLLFFGSLVVLTQGTAIAPFIYTIF